MTRKLIGISLCLQLVLWLVGSASAANKPKAELAASDGVQTLLQSETSSGNGALDRRDALNPAKRSNVSESAWWQAGYVRSDKQWVPFEESVSVDASLKLLDEYRTQREKLSDESHGHWRLATWCKKQGLPDQERVHLLKALESRDSWADGDAVYERLGCKKYGNCWVSPQEQRETLMLNAEIEQSHKRWDSKLAAVIKLLQGTPDQRAQAKKEMASIRQCSAVPAIVEAFCMADRPLADYGVKVLGQIPEYQASRALAGQAIFSPWKPLRTKAIELLKVRKLEEFAPDLLLLLSNPIRPGYTATIQATPAGTSLMAPNVKINLDYVWIEETRDSIRVGIRRLFPTSMPASLVHVLRPHRPQFNGTYDSTGNRSAGSTDGAVIDLASQKDFLDYTADAMNDCRQEMNERVGTVLSQCADQPMSSDAQNWWDWWANFSSVASPDQKNVVIVDERLSQPNIPSFASTSVYIPVSCLVAATPVWTERGAVPIEQILPGDRVLSKDVTSGELAYKPVIATTVRKPTSVQTFRVGTDSITASLGHHFWVSGDGWTKMRKLASEMPLHTATGMQRISAVEEDGQIEKVYNLVVADFHTYFVGKSMILSHDVQTPNLTNVKVPGLVPQ